MTIAIATLSAGQQNEFLRRKSRLTSDQRQCLYKVFELIANDAVQSGGTGDDAASAIANFITTTVLAPGNPDYCAEHRKRLDQVNRS